MNGRIRVVIENVQPSVDGGLYPVKRCVGETVHVGADIFSDGHDTVRADLLYRPPGCREWETVRMEPAGNDRWKADFRVTAREGYVFTVRAWVDRLGTTVRDLEKKTGSRAGLRCGLQAFGGRAQGGFPPGIR